LIDIVFPPQDDPSQSSLLGAEQKTNQALNS
jgi:hypothetical protein